jgi:hypothetical protein
MGDIDLGQGGNLQTLTTSAEGGAKASPCNTSEEARHMCRCREGIPEQTYSFFPLSNRRRRGAGAPGVLRAGARRLRHGVSLTLRT